MIKRLIGLALCLMLACAGPALSAGNDYGELGESDWYGTTTDEERIDMAWDLMHEFRYLGYPMGHLNANDFAQAMNDYYDQDKSLPVWAVACIVLDQQLIETDHAEYLSQMDSTFYHALYEPDWYGETTDDARIAMALDLLNLLRLEGNPVAGIADHEFAQAMNDYYDQDKSLSVWEVAAAVYQNEFLPGILDGESFLWPSDLDADDAEWYMELYEPEWYGDTTDDTRVAMAWELMSILRAWGYDIGRFAPNDFAQAMNDYYDQDKSLPVWEVACIVAE